MTDIYLTEEVKLRYMNDFINNVLSFNRNETWKLDEGLSDILSEINKNQYIQTLYSKKCLSAVHGNESLSYLKFCYSQQIELKLFREVIPSIFYDLDVYEGTKFYYDFNDPHENPNYSKGSTPVGLGCLDDENYFHINTLSFNLESYSSEAHEIFWNVIRKRLTLIKP